ncbi:unnamed protein product [Spodoptera exigua]|nr:unnamed protein product [Spodoptera exigua]
MRLYDGSEVRSLKMSELGVIRDTHQYVAPGLLLGCGSRGVTSGARAHTYTRTHGAKQVVERRRRRPVGDITNGRLIELPPPLLLLTPVMLRDCIPFRNLYYIDPRRSSRRDTRAWIAASAAPTPPGARAAGEVGGGAVQFCNEVHPLPYSRLHFIETTVLITYQASLCNCWRGPIAGMVQRRLIDHVAPRPLCSTITSTCVPYCN